MNRKKIYFVGLIFIFISLILPNTYGEKITFSESNIDDWYYLPAYPNYAPNGLPDFSQKQDENWKGDDGYWLVCAAASIADVLWWFDSKYSDPDGFPGDGFDNFSLISDFKAPNPPNPGPNSDDHNYNNVNDMQTSWDKNKLGGELIDQLAWYIYGSFFKFNIPKGPIIGGIIRGIRIKWCLNKWIRDADLRDFLKARYIIRPSFSTLNERLRNNDGIILCLFGAGYDPELPPLPLLWGHCVALAGINSNGFIAVSDPFRDIENPGHDPIERNNASIVSHDIYKVNFSSPFPLLSSWWLDSYDKGVLVSGAIVISEVDKIK